MKDTIYRADAIKAVAHEYGGKRIRSVGETVADILQALKALPSAEAVEVDRDTEWVAVRRDEYEDFLASAEATCATCADRAMCIMSAPDGNWKACKDYRPIVAEDLNEAYKRGFEDAKRAFLLEYARESENMLKRNAELEVMLNAQKAISSEAVPGEWIEKNSHTFICNQCGFEQAIYGTPQGEGYFFCPHCGAIMKGGDDE